MERYVGAEELELLHHVVPNQVLYRSDWHGQPGQFVEQFEQDFARYTGVRFVLAVNSGTSALQAALAAAGVGLGDEVIVTTCSFVASSLCVLAPDAIPVFADVDARTFALDPADITREITSRTKAFIPVHLFGQLCEIGVSKMEYLQRCKAACGVSLSHYPPVPNHLEPVYSSGLYKRSYPPGVRWHPDNPPFGPGLLPVLEKALPATLITIMFHHGDDLTTDHTLARGLKETAVSLTTEK